MNNKVESVQATVIHIGGLDMQICIPRNWNDNQVRDYANKNNPCGTRKGWQIRRKGDPLLNGAKERTPCKSDLGHKVHIMLDA